MHSVLTFSARTLYRAGFVLLCALPAAAQCALQVAAAEPGPGITGPAWASRLWDPDGAGPAPVQVVVGGEFAAAGAFVANGVAAYDPASGQWSAFGAGPGMRVLTTAVLANGRLAVAGMRPAVSTTSVLVWDGAGWSPLGSSFALNGQVVVRALATRPNGDLVAAGNFTSIGGVPVQHVARFDGVAWQPLGAGLDAQALALTVLPNGDVVAGGTFTTAGGVASPFAARWDGAAWQPMTAGLGAWVTALHVRANGELLASSGGFVVRWNGAAWVPLGPSPGFPVHAFAETAAGELLVGGDTLGGVRVWTGSTWAVATLSTGRIQETLTVLPNGHLIAGGTFGLRRWTGASWLSLSSPLDRIQALAPARDGSVLAGGYFAAAGTTTLAARWNGTAWQPLPGLQGIVPRGVADDRAGRIVAAAETTPGVVETRLWTGSGWAITPGGGGIRAFAARADGELFGGGADGVLHWTGTSWMPHVGGFTGVVYELLALPDGVFVVAGSLDFGGGQADRVARWDGLAWSVLADVWVGGLALTDAGIVAGGTFASIGGVPAQNVARWDGSAWQPLGGGLPGQVTDLAAVPDGDLVATTAYAGAWRWNGAAWTLLASADGFLRAAEFGADGLFVAGHFAMFQGVASPSYARLVTPCPAGIAPAGAGCSGSLGPVQLDVVEAAWVGGTVRSTATGVPANGIAVAVWGLAPAAVPLPSVLPLALPGCTLWVAPDLLGASVPAVGAASSSLAVPDALPLVGQSLRHQVVGLELAFLGSAIAAVTASNAVELTIGAF